MSAMSGADPVKAVTFNDPVHHTIEMHPLCLKIIDTPEFQRLRNVKQCGICHFVYPSAVHTRFEHSIGVYHVAGMFLDKIKTKVDVTFEEDLCVRVAALLHDIGHGPFSHLWERFVNGRNEKEFKHEQMSLEIFNRLMKRPEISEEFKKNGLEEDHIKLISKIIIGNPDSVDSDKLFLLEIVANKKTNIDVDRWEYMMRDAYFFGVTCPVRIDRIVSYTAVMKKDNQLRIAFRDKLRENILEMFNCRMKLHKICYQHRVCKNLDIMLIDALNAADENFLKNKLKLSTCHEDISSFLSLNDSIFENILHSTEEELKDARAILKRIITRDLYDLIDTLLLKRAVPQKHLMKVEKKLNGSKNLEKNRTPLRLGIIDINMGIDGEDPLKPVLFFPKRDELEDSFRPSDYLYPREIKLLVFSTTKIEDRNLKNTVLNELKEEMKEFLDDKEI